MHSHVNRYSVILGPHSESLDIELLAKDAKFRVSVLKRSRFREHKAGEIL